MYACPFTSNIFFACQVHCRKKWYDGYPEPLKFWPTISTSATPPVIMMQTSSTNDCCRLEATSICLIVYKCFLHCCPLMSLRKTFVSARADTRRRSGVSCDLIMWRTVFPIGHFKIFKLAGKKESHMQALAQILSGCSGFTWLPTVLTSNFKRERLHSSTYVHMWKRTCNRIINAILLILQMLSYFFCLRC